MSACKRGLTATKIAADLRRRLSVITGADIRISQPRARDGARLRRRLPHDDRGPRRRGYPALEAVARDIADAASKDPAVTNTYVGFNSPQPPASIARVDRDKAEMLGGAPAASVFATIADVSCGNLLSTNINLIGHTFQVIAMAERLHVPAGCVVGGHAQDAVRVGSMVPLSFRRSPS